MIFFEKANESDIEKIYSFAQELILKYEDRCIVNIEKALAWTKNKIAENIDEYTVIYYADKKCGYFHLCKNEDLWELDDLYIFPEYRRKGIAKEVVKRCIDEKENIYLYVFVENIGAIKLYENLGFKFEKEVSKTRAIMKYKKNPRQ